MSKLIRPELYQIYVDSLKIRIDFDHIENLKTDFSENLKVINIQSGEIIQDFEKNKITISNNGINTHFAIENLISSQDGSQKKYLCIRVSSKIIKKRYFQGISIYTLSYMYSELMKLNLFFVTMKNFYSSKFSDVDLCYNYEYESVKKEYEKFKEFSKFVLPSREINRGVKIYPKETKKYNKGVTLQFNTKGFEGFKRIYTKDLELKTKSLEFTKNYLSEVDFDKIMRYECNIWNAAQLKKLTDQNTLLNFLYWLAENQKTAFDYMHKQLTNEIRKTIMIKTKKITINDLIILEFINAIQETDSPITWEGVFDLLVIKQDNSGAGRKRKTDINKKLCYFQELIESQNYTHRYTTFELLFIKKEVKNKKLDKRKIHSSIKSFL